MKLSSGCLYSLRALMFLARHDGAGFFGAAEVAGAHGVPEEYLRKALNHLVAAGVLRSLRGRNGGYRLARPAKAITLLDVVEAVDGSLGATVARFGADGKLHARLHQTCTATAEAVRVRLRKVSVADLATGSEG